MDAKDIAILKLLQSDGRLTTAEIAERVNLSQAPCWRRINQYEQDGIIERKVHLLNREKLGLEIVVFASVNLTIINSKALEAFEQAVAQFPEVVECYTMTGMIDYMLKIIAKDIHHYELFVRNQLTAIPNIGALHSHVAVTKIKDTTELPLDSQR